MENSDNFSCEDKPNKRRTGLFLNIDDLKTYLRIKFISNREAGEAAGISNGRVRQIINGFEIPSTPTLIRQLANGWGVDPIKLTLLFDEVRK